MNRNYKITPFIGLESIHLGFRKDKTRGELSDHNFRSFQKSEFEEVDSDHYPSLGLIFHYDSDNRIEAIEIVDADGVVLNDKDLFGVSKLEIEKTYVSSSQNHVIEEGQGVLFYDLGFGVGYNENDQVNYVFLFTKEYWDE